eukprot:scaffold4739_cov66-Isochrysis_galbana.AAC.1
MAYLRCGLRACSGALQLASRPPILRCAYRLPMKLFPAMPAHVGFLAPTKLFPAVPTCASWPPPSYFRLCPRALPPPPSALSV